MRTRNDGIESLLKQQYILQFASKETIREIVKKGNLRRVSKGKVIAKQGGWGGEVFFILSGEIAVEVKGIEVAIRKAGELVGEMSSIESIKRRSATLRVLQGGTLFVLDGKVFQKCVFSKINVAKALLFELCNRLRDCAQFVLKPNSKPRLFIASSKESLKLAKLVKESFSAIDVDVDVWNENVFKPSSHPIDALMAQARCSDFAIVVLTRDDLSCSRKSFYEVPRDNIIFELGLFIGAIGLNRTYMLCEEKNMEKIKLPSDIDGITKLSYKREKGTYDMENAICKVISMIEQMGAKRSLQR
ncbi:MAG: nucleotide-binding protein [Kiritimatiellae bacterium]|nr:nucleotide-binding protein [Kiritimatiellia bacterium]